MRDKVVLVTGAGLGIGRAICERLAEEGAEVVVTSRTPQHLQATAAAVAAIAGREPLAMAVDVGEREAVERAVAAVADRFGRLDVVCNNAGMDLPRAPRLDEVTDREWDTLFRVNVTGMFHVCRAALPLMPDGSAIVNLGSVNSFVAWPNATPYTATKGAVLQFTRGLALDVAARGIRVNCVCPGIVDTPLTQSFIQASEDPDATIAAYDSVAPLGRMGTPHEVASCVVFLASDEASFVTGAALLVDGGATASG